MFVVPITVLPGGQSGQKLQNRPGEKKSWLEEFVAEFWSNLTKSGRKGNGENFLKKFIFLQ
jgi:hypothetical protein